MTKINTLASSISSKNIMTFIAITFFYFFEFSQMSYFIALAPEFLSQGIYHSTQIAEISASYFYGTVIGLLPAGFLLDRFPLRKILLLGILGSVFGAFLLLTSNNFYLQWSARFICGFFGGTFSFIGGIRIIAALFPTRFTYFMGIFLAAGMAGGMICLYPLLIAVNHIGIMGAMTIMALTGVAVLLVNFLWLRPPASPVTSNKSLINKSVGKQLITIFKNYRNWFDCFMIVLLDAPVSIIGTLWGIVILMHGFHLSDFTSSYVVMSLFLGLIIGMPFFGKISDRYHHPAWLIVLGSSVSFIAIMGILFLPMNTFLLMILFFMLGVFSSVQTMGFTWLTKNMKPELIGLNSGINSMVLMTLNGVSKQIGAVLLITTPLIASPIPSFNLLLLIAGAFLVCIIYALLRKHIFKHQKTSTLIK